MSNRFDDFSRVPRTPTTARPLLGITVLIVEDSRYACEAVRLKCQKCDARIRRAASFKAALRHLSCYRPSVVIADMGLPDGSGVDLIGKLAQTRGRDMVLLGTSANDEAAKAFEQAGADGFLPKPIPSISAFQHAILSHMPPELQPVGLRPVDNEGVTPDKTAYHDDLLHIAKVIKKDPEDVHQYAVHFLAGLARLSNDPELLEHIRTDTQFDRNVVLNMIDQRIQASSPPEAL